MPPTGEHTRPLALPATTSRGEPENSARIVRHIGSDPYHNTTKKAMVMNVELAHPEVWMTEGLCTQTDPEVFYPRPGESRTMRIAKQICHDCPIQMRCLTYALKHREQFGIWGGFTPSERRRMNAGLEEIRRSNAA